MALQAEGAKRPALDLAQLPLHDGTFHHNAGHPAAVPAQSLHILHICIESPAAADTCRAIIKLAIFTETADCSMEIGIPYTNDSFPIESAFHSSDYPGREPTDTAHGHQISSYQ